MYLQRAKKLTLLKCLCCFQESLNNSNLESFFVLIFNLV